MLPSLFASDNHSTRYAVTSATPFSIYGCAGYNRRIAADESENDKVDVRGRLIRP